MEQKQEDLNWNGRSLFQANINFNYFRKDDESKWLSNKIFPLRRASCIVHFLLEILPKHFFPDATYKKSYNPVKCVLTPKYLIKC